jgi:hypothetical protein
LGPNRLAAAIKSSRFFGERAPRVPSLSSARPPRAAGLENTYKQIVVANQDIIQEAAEAESKKELKFWQVCAETMGGPDGVLDLTQFENDPCSHIMVYMRGQCKETIVVSAVRSAAEPSRDSPPARIEHTANRLLRAPTQGPNAPKIKKLLGDLLEEFKPHAE